MEHENETQTDLEDSFFHQTLDKWAMLNLTEGYGAFQREIRPEKLVLLPQLVHHKSVIVEVLMKHLRLKNGLYLQPLLE